MSRIIIEFPSIISFLLLSIMSLTLVCCQRGRIHPEVDLTLEQRVKRHGYPIETHEVTTEDDYLLSLYHIPHGLNGGKDEPKNKSVVLLGHGMGGSPHNFIILGKKLAPVYYFADHGMDVWLFSSRGVEGSFKKKHKKYDWNKDREYWMYSYHEIGKYDLSATIDYILNYTGQTKLSYIGHSAGGAEYFCMVSEKPGYNEKVNVAISWGSSPVIFGHDFPIFLLGAELTDIFRGVIEYFDLVELMPLFPSFKPTLRLLCADPDWQKMCIMGSWVIGSHKSVLQRANDIQLFISDIPRLSSRMVLHFMSNIKRRDFTKYDHGPKGNMKHYGQKHPPSYNLSAATAPVAFFIGPNDSEITSEDVQAAIERIPNPVLIYEVAFPKFTHLDFLGAYNASELVYEPTYRLMKDIDDGIVYPSINKRNN